MMDYFNILRKMLKVMGLDIFSKQVNNWHLIIRFIYIVTLLFFITAMFYYSFDSKNDFVDKLLKCVYNLGNTIVFVQIVVFLRNKSKILDLSTWLKESYSKQNLMIVHRYSTESLVQRYKTISMNLLKFSLSSACVTAICNCIVPFIIPDGYIYPLDITFTKNMETINGYLNFGLHVYMWLLNSTFITVKSCLFISFTMNLLFKLKLISEICSCVGESEELRFTKLFNADNEATELRNTANEMNLKAYKTSKIKSSIKLKLIINLHNDVLAKFVKMVQVEEINLLTSEILLLSASIGFFTLLISGNLTRSTPLLLLTLTIYVQIFLVCLAGSLIQMGFEAIGNSLYTSKWYWLAPSDREVLLTVMVVANKARMLSVGKCKSANLQRFTIISKTLYQFYFIVKVFLE